MKKIITLSVACFALLNASDTVELKAIQVTEKINSKVMTNISSEQIKSADLAEALIKNVPSASIVRRSGIANDIILRGQKKDNINILIDNSKIYGACPNRMDPPTSHILTNNIESIEVTEGPYDVENFGTLSGLVKIKTKEPTKELSGEINLNVGSYGYKKGSFAVSGGNDYVRFLLSASKETSDQYEDGDRDNFLEQQVKHGVPLSSRYSEDDFDAYEKTTVLTKLIFDIDDSSNVAVSYTANRSDNVLYPNTPMDADYDDSDIFTLDYEKRDLGKYSKIFNLEYYYSKVDHPMSISNRNNATMMKDMTNHMKSSIWGAKLKNTLDLANGELSVGLDTSIRNWKGRKFNNDLSVDTVSLTSTDTDNKAIFSTYKKTIDKFDLEFGARYDHTSIDPDDTTKKENNYDELNANIFTTYNLNDNTKFFAGIGKSSRVPDARELYYSGSGNQNLESVKNYELDLGVEKTYENISIKTKVFYSMLKDYIYNNNGTSFENIDADIYGIEVSGLYLINNEFSLDFGLAYQKGKKDEALSGQSDRDLAEIPPLKANLSLTYENGQNMFTTQIVAVDSWDNYDSDNGEQELSGYAIVNAKYNYKINKNFDISLGVDNIFDKTYTSTNTYNDINYIGIGETELFNDPGRYAYVNLKYSF